jgi:hypothetical protein
VTDWGQPVEPGEELPLLMRLGRDRTPEMTAQRRSDGRVVDVLATIGARRSTGDVPREDQVTDWRPWP